MVASKTSRHKLRQPYPNNTHTHHIIKQRAIIIMHVYYLALHKTPPILGINACTKAPCERRRHRQHKRTEHDFKLKRCLLKSLPTCGELFVVVLFALTRREYGAQHYVCARTPQATQLFNQSSSLQPSIGYVGDTMGIGARATTVGKPIK